MSRPRKEDRPCVRAEFIGSTRLIDDIPLTV